jgi:hypothetical protein
MATINRPNTDTMVDNIEYALKAATKDEVFSGIAWYPTALADAADIARKSGISVIKVAGIIAALSPQMPWTRNVKVADAFIVSVQNGLNPRGQTKNNTEKALRIFNGPDSVQAVAAELLGVSGFKTANFFLNIVGTTGDGVSHKYAYTLMGATVDRFAIGIAYGVYFGNNVPSMTAKQYAEIAQAYVIVAERHGYRPEEVQAITWLSFRRIHGVDVVYGG